jgi:hypothetical protein
MWVYLKIIVDIRIRRSIVYVTDGENEMSNRPNLYECSYAHDRRNHRHRCQCCNKIVNTDEQVIMYKISSKVSRVLHIECADKPSFDNLTFRQLAQLHSNEYAKACGYKI